MRVTINNEEFLIRFTEELRVCSSQDEELVSDKDDDVSYSSDESFIPPSMTT